MYASNFEGEERYNVINYFCFPRDIEIAKPLQTPVRFLQQKDVRVILNILP